MQDASMKLISVKCHNLEMCLLNGLKKSNHVKVRSFFEHSCAILSSFKIVVIFNNTSADFVLISADALLKMTTILKELRIAQLRSKNKRTLDVNASI